MSKYRIFEPINTYDNNTLKITLSSFASASRNNDNVYYIKTELKNYLIIDTPLNNVSLNRMFIHELSVDEFISRECIKLVNIQYENTDKDLIIVRMKINELLDGFSCNTQRIPMILTSNNSTEQIDFYSVFDIYRPSKITETYKVGSVIPKYKALIIKQNLKDNKEVMQDYIISQIIDKHYVAKRYEVKI